MESFHHKILEERSLDGKYKAILGYEVDVGCIDENIYIECGDIEPRKIFEFLRNGLNIGILQYNAEHIIWFLTSEKFQKYAKEKAYGYL